MHPILFTIGDFSLYSYGLMMAIGVLVALRVLDSEARRYGWNTDLMTRLVVVTFLFGLLGARIAYVLTRISDPTTDVVALILNVRAGFVYYGGLISSWLYLSWFLYRHRKELPLWPTMDAMAMGICVGLAIGRIGCFLGGCCFGSGCDYPWGVTMVGDAHLGHVHPVQLYEFAMLMVFLAWMWWRRTRKAYDGELVVFYTGAYAIGRFVLEYWRGDLIRGFVWEPYVSTSQFLSLGFLPLAVWVHLKRRGTTPLKALKVQGKNS